MKIAFASIFCLLGSTAVAAPFQTSAEAEPYLCSTPEAAVDAYRRNHSAHDAAYDLIAAGTCRKVPGDTKFRVITTGKADGRLFSQVEILDAPRPESPEFLAGVLNQPIDPEEQARQRELAKPPIGCTTPSGGEVRRLERGKDGQVYIKRFMVTSKCVNGEMRSFSTPID